MTLLSCGGRSVGCRYTLLSTLLDCWSGVTIYPVAGTLQTSQINLLSIAPALCFKQVLEGVAALLQIRISQLFDPADLVDARLEREWPFIGDCIEACEPPVSQGKSAILLRSDYIRILQANAGNKKESAVSRDVLCNGS